MTDQRSDTMLADPDEWTEFFEAMNQNFAKSMEQSVNAQAEFVEAWMEAMEAAVDGEEWEDGIEGYANAYEVWMDALEQGMERSRDVMLGEEVAPEEFRDLWLNAANQAIKEVTSTTAFAAMTGQTVEEALNYRQVIDEQAEDTLHTLGFATKGDIIEIGERIVELERRQHAIEQKLDDLLEQV